jgi:hypothetical protein
MGAFRGHLELLQTIGRLRFLTSAYPMLHGGSLSDHHEPNL